MVQLHRKHKLTNAPNDFHNETNMANGCHLIQNISLNVKLTSFLSQKTIAFYERLYEGLEILVDFFHANDKGLPMSAIRSKLYEVGSIFYLIAKNTIVISDATDIYPTGT